MATNHNLLCSSGHSRKPEETISLLGTVGCVDVASPPCLFLMVQKKRPGDEASADGAELEDIISYSYPYMYSRTSLY